MSEEKSDKLTRVTPADIQPGSMDDLYRLAKAAAGTGFFGASSPEQALILMMAGRDCGFSYTQSLRAFHVIKGKPSLSANAMVAVCLNSDKCEYFRCVSGDKNSVTWETKRKGNPARSITFTIEEAKEAGLVTDMYRKFPRQMLSARSASSLAREVYPELLMGIYDPDEIENTGAAYQVQRVAEVLNAKVPSQAPAAVEVKDADVIDEVVHNPLDTEFSSEAIDALSSVNTLDELKRHASAYKLKLGHRGDLLAAFRAPYTKRFNELKESEANAAAGA